MVNHNECQLQDDVIKLEYFLICRFRKTVVKIRDFYEFTVPRMAQRYYRRYFRMYPDTVHNLIEYLMPNERIQRLLNNRRIPMEKKIHMTLAYLGSKMTTLQ